MERIRSARSLARHLQHILLILFTATTLAACSGGSSSDSITRTEDDRSLETTTGNDDDTAASDAGTDSSDADLASDVEAATAGTYRRPADYPRMKTLPLQFIQASSGKRIGLVVTMPADRNGRPAEGPFPVILTHTAYNLNAIGALPMPGGALTAAPDTLLVKRGYIQVNVDALGTGVSQGGWEMLGGEEQAAYADVVDWVEQQPWFNGKLGMAGASYMAISSLFAAEQRPDSVDAIFASVPMGDAMRGTVGTGGMINGVFMSVWLTLTQILTTQNVPAILKNPGQFNPINEATQEHVAQIDNYYLPVIADALNGADYLTYDSEFWRTRSPLENIDRIKAPTLLFGASHDIFQRDVPLIYERMKQNGVDTRLVIYNGDHVGHFMQAFLGTRSVAPMPYLMLQWFDKHLKGMDTGTENLPPVVQYVRNHHKNRFKSYVTTTDWPHPQAVAERWYLHGDKTLTRDAPVEEEATRSIDAAEATEVAYGKSDDGNFLNFTLTLNDGTKCSPSYVQWTLGGAGLAKAPSCYVNNRRLEQDALNYQTAPMDEDYYFNGPLQADIWMETTATEAVLSVRVDEVSKNGRLVAPLSNGLLLASARAVDESRSRFMNGEMIQPYHFFTKEAVEPVVPGEPFKMQVEIFPASVIIKKGHRLRVSIATSNQAQGILNLEREAKAAGGVTTLHNSPRYPSSLVVPAVPLSALH